MEDVRQLLLADIKSHCSKCKKDADEDTTIRVYLKFRLVKWGLDTMPIKKLEMCRGFCGKCAKKVKYLGFNADKVWCLPPTSPQGMGEK